MFPNCQFHQAGSTDTCRGPSVSPELRERYIEIIDSILAKSDLETISEKRIRQGVQDVVGYDLTPQKVRFQLSLSQIDIHACASVDTTGTMLTFIYRLQLSS